jgi:hypothetical protein
MASKKTTSTSTEAGKKTFATKPAPQKKPLLALISSHGRILIGMQKNRGGLIKNGLDAGGYHMMETKEGLNALKMFTQMGQVKPLYLSQEFFDSQQ